MINRNEGVYSFYDTHDHLGEDDEDSDAFEMVGPSSLDEISLNEFDIVDLPALPQSVQKEQTSQNTQQRVNDYSQQTTSDNSERSLKFSYHQKIIYSGKIKSNETVDINLNGLITDFQLESNQENVLFIKTNSQIQVKQYLETYNPTIVQGPLQIGQNWIICSKENQSTTIYEDETMEQQISHLQYSTNQFRNIYDENGQTKVGQIVWDGENFTYQHYSSHVKARMNLQNNSRFASDTWYLINNQMYYFEY